MLQKKIITVNIILFLSFLHGYSRDKEALQVPKASTQMTIDGNADEGCWQKAKAHSFDNFYATEKSGDKQNTILKMLWDEENLYFFFECTDQFITAREKNRDGKPFFDDCAEIFLIPAADKIKMHFGFEVNLYKASNDFVFLNQFYKKNNVVVKSYSPDFDVAVTVDGTVNDNSDTDKGWTMEMAIPLNAFYTVSSLTPVEAGVQWAFLALRQDRNDPEGNRRSTSTIFPLTRINRNVHNPKCFGLMEFVVE